MGKLLSCKYEDPSLTAKTHIKKASMVAHACNHDCNPDAGGVETADPHGVQASQPTEAVSLGLTKQSEPGKTVPQTKAFATSLTSRVRLLRPVWW